MATIKSYTDLKHSKKLAKILSHESADMFYVAGKGEPIFIGNRMVACGNDDYDALGVPDVLCWSLASLLSVVPEVSLNSFKDGNWNVMVQQNGKMIYGDTDNPVDACCELILKLHEQNLI